MNTIKDHLEKKELKFENKNIQLEEKIDIPDCSKEFLNKKNIILNTIVNITVELGQTKIAIKDFLNFSKDSVLILDKSIQEPLNIFINGYLVASGEIVFLKKKYGVRITSIKNSE